MDSLSTAVVCREASLNRQLVNPELLLETEERLNCCYLAIYSERVFNDLVPM